MSEYVLSSEKDKEKLLGVIKEVSNAMTRVAAERDFIKDAVKDAEEYIGIPKKIIRKMATIYYKRNFDEVKSEQEDIEELYTTVVKE